MKSVFEHIKGMTRRDFIKYLILIGGGVAAFAGGYVLGRITTPTKTRTINKTQTQNITQASSVYTNNSRIKELEKIVNQLQNEKESLLKEKEELLEKLSELTKKERITIDYIIESALSASVVGSLVEIKYVPSEEKWSVKVYYGTGIEEVTYPSSREINALLPFLISISMQKQGLLNQKENYAFVPTSDSKIIAMLQPNGLELLFTKKGEPKYYLDKNGYVYGSEKLQLDKKITVDFVASNVYGFVKKASLANNQLYILAENGKQKFSVTIQGVGVYKKEIDKLLASLEKEEKILLMAYGKIKNNINVIVPLNEPGYRATLITKKDYVRMLSPDLAT